MTLGNPKYLKASLVCFLIAGIALTLIIQGCSGVSLKGVCRHEAVYAATVMGEQYPVRIATGLYTTQEIPMPRLVHSEAQVWIDNKWQRLGVNWPSVGIVEPDPMFIPFEFFKVDDFVKRLWLLDINRAYPLP